VILQEWDTLVAAAIGTAIDRSSANGGPVFYFKKQA